MAEESQDFLRNYRISIIRKTALLVASIIIVVLFVGLMSVSVCQDIPLSRVYEYIWNHICGTEYVPRSEEWWNDRFIWNRSIPRCIGAILAGAGLAAAGAMMQSLMNNPLADPYSTGISSGACLGAVSAIIVGVSFASFSSETSTIVFAFFGAIIPALIIILISTRILMTPATLILMGTAISYFFNSMVTYLMVTTDADSLQNAYIWQIGSLDSITWANLPFMATITLVGIVIILMLSKQLNILSLGDASAKTLGLDVKNFRIVCLILMALITAGIVSFTGILGFIGLVTPHIVRMIVGSDNKFVIPISMAFSAALLLVADYLSLTVIHVQVGAVLALIGSPIFFFLIVHQKKGRGIY